MSPDLDAPALTHLGHRHKMPIIAIEWENSWRTAISRGCGRAQESVRILTVRETAWFNVDPETIWRQVFLLEEWARGCAGLESARWLRGEPWSPGARFELIWSGAASAPLVGGEIHQVEEVGVCNTENREPSLRSSGSQLNDDNNLWARRICWRAGFGPFRSEGRMSFLEDGTGTLVEFVTHWQGWAALLSKGRRSSRCANYQRDWLASLRESLERVGSIG